MSPQPTNIVLFARLASEQFSKWVRLEDGIRYLSGPARWVIFCLIAMFLASAAASIEHFVVQFAAIWATRRFIRKTRNAFLEQDDEAVKRIAAENVNVWSHIAALTETAVSGYASARMTMEIRDAVALSVREMERSKTRLTTAFKRRLALLASIAATAPLVGLLGTVFAILDSTRGFSMSHAAALSFMAGASAEALITTAMGLVVAVPTVWSYNYLSERSELMTIEMEIAAREVHTYLLKREAKRP